MIPRVVAITPGDGRALDPWLEALAPRVDAVILREPGAAPADVARWVARVRGGGALAIVHARAGRGGDLAHLPDGAAPVGGPFGASCHDGPGLDRAFAAGAAYALLSPVWAPSSKADPRAPLGLERFCALAAGRPVLALGGIDAARCRAARARGYGVAGIGWFFSAATPAEAAARAAALQS